MVMFTQLLRYAVEDEQGRRARLHDMCIALLDDDYPPVTHVIFDYEGKHREIEWDDVASIDPQSSKIRVKDLDAREFTDRDGDVLVGRDLLDALVLDLLGRRTTRVCDIALDEEDGALRVKGADAGLAALVRRVTGGLFGKPNEKNAFDWKYVEFLRGDPNAVDNGAGYRLRINRLPAGEIARLADYIPYLHAAELLKLLPDEKAADVLQAMSVERQLQVIEELPEEEAVDLVRRMSPDLATDLLGRLHVDTMRRFITMLPKRRQGQIVELLRYPENSVGGSMVNDVISIPADVTAEAAQLTVRDCIKETEFVSLVFVVDGDDDGKLRGSVSLRQLVSADPETRLEDLMDPYLETLDPFQLASEAAHRIIDGQLEAMPVTNSHGRLIGAMTIGAAVSMLLPTASGGRLKVFS